MTNRLRGSGSVLGTEGTGAPAGAPACGTLIEAVAKWPSTCKAIRSGLARSAVIAELRASKP